MTQAEDMAFAVAMLAREDSTCIPHASDHSPVPEAAAAIVKTKYEHRPGEQTRQWKKLVASLSRLEPAQRQDLAIAWHVKQGRAQSGTQGWTSHSTPGWVRAVKQWMSA